jgi:cytosine/adenosine deaminase-related metal-dependent hydrolase
MKIAIVNAQIVLPDKGLILEDASLLIENGLISRIDQVRYRFDYSANVLINAEGGYLIPGLINNHSHGFTLGPLFPSGNQPMTFELIFRNLNRHLLQGTTTLLNVDGFALIEEVEAVNKLHPIKIKTGTTHMPLNMKAAELADGAGLTKAHKEMTVAEMLERGSSVIGEVGAGSTLGGGAASYYLLPRAIEEKTGKIITAIQAERLKRAVLGRYIDPSFTDKEKIKAFLKESGLEESLTVEEVIEITMKVVYASVEVAREGIKEAADLALKYDVPVIIHNAAASKDVVLEVAERLGPKLIAAHSNHMSYDKDEMLEVARELRKSGAIIDVCSGDSFGARQINPADYIEPTLDMIEEGIAEDIISTDFMGGNWDSILRILEEAVERKKISLPKAIAMATYNVVKAIPRLAPNGGVIEEGKTADIVILDKNRLSKVRHVLINGIPVVIDGVIKAPRPDWIW